MLVRLASTWTMADPASSGAGKWSGIWQGLECSNQVQGQDRLEQHAGRLRCLDPEAGRGFVWPSRKDDPAGTLLANSLSGFDAIDAASHTNGGWSLPLSGMECGGKTGLSLELITRRWYQTDIYQHDCWTMS
jgi:hypothetical protein